MYPSAAQHIIDGKLETIASGPPDDAPTYATVLIAKRTVKLAAASGIPLVATFPRLFEFHLDHGLFKDELHPFEVELIGQMVKDVSRACRWEEWDDGEIRTFRAFVYDLEGTTTYNVAGIR